MPGPAGAYACSQSGVVTPFSRFNELAMEHFINYESIFEIICFKIDAFTPDI